MNSWFDCLLDYFIRNQYINFNKGISQLLSFTISTVLKTATYLQFRYIKLKMQEEKKNKDKISEKNEAPSIIASIDFAQRPRINLKWCTFELENFKT